MSQRFSLPRLALGICFALLVVFQPRVANAGSPFYLTVERSFSNTERPEVRLDYVSAAEPILFRVLRPKDVEKFLDGQVQLSRSYEEPVALLNPGHYVLSGLNDVRSPLEVLRRSLSVEFRKEFKGETFANPIFSTPSRTLTTVPEEVFQGPPAGFEVVREFVVDLQFGGVNTLDQGWWFAGGAWGEGGYKVRSVPLDSLSDGVYLLQAVQGRNEAQVLLQVSSIAVQVKQSTSQLLVRVLDRALNPVVNASVAFRDGRGVWQSLKGQTDESGQLLYQSPAGALDGKLIVRVQASNQRAAYVDTDFLPAVSPEPSVFMVTDRPIFKPGEQFFFKGIIRESVGGKLQIPPFKESEARLTLYQADGQPTELEQKVKISEFGSFSGDFLLDEAQAPGLYRVVAEVDGKPYGGEFRVRDYVKPQFYLELLERSPIIKPGEKFSFKFKARRYAGGAPRQAKYEVFVYRKRFEVPTWVVESGGDLSAGQDYFGEVKSTSALTQPQRIYSSIEERQASQGEQSSLNNWETASEINAEGEVVVDINLPAIKREADGDSPATTEDQGEWIYTVMVRARDRAGSTAVLTENIYMTLAEALPLVRFSQTMVDMGTGGAIALVRSTFPDGLPAPKAEGQLALKIEKADGSLVDLPTVSFVTDTQGTAKVPLPNFSEPGRLVAVAMLNSQSGKPFAKAVASEPAAMIVTGPGNAAILRNRELMLFAESTLLVPEERARMLALLPEGWGKSERGVLWQTIAGSQVFEVKGAEIIGRTAWVEIEAKQEYGTGFYQTVTVPVGEGKFAEETLGFRILPKNQRLTIEITPEREVVEPLKPMGIRLLVKDALGNPAADVELSVNVVDRAVYAVQPEFRPEISNFFYPLPRLNLATYYSDDLQGYGYADKLRKPNFSLAALKSQSKPTKKSMRDTAGWYPHVVTDSAGVANITVDMPANVTEWLVTVVAIDKVGRLGEARAQFRSATDIVVEGVVPQFLREGDEALARVRTINQTDKNQSLKLVPYPGVPTQVEIAPKNEVIIPIVVSGTAPSGVATIRQTVEAEPGIKTGGAQEFDVALQPATLEQRIFSSGFGAEILQPNLAENGKVRELRLQISSGILGAALGAAENLVTYPYGCTEQLVHSTVPNLVLMDLLTKAKIDEEQLGPLRTVLLKAKRNAAQGIAKLIANQRSGGGFAPWPGDFEAAFGTTVIAAAALKLASELGVEGADNAFQKTFVWLGSRSESGVSANGSIYSGYLLANLAELKYWRAPHTQMATFVMSAAASDTTPRALQGNLDEIINSLRILKAYENETWNRFHQDLTTEAAVLREQLVFKLKESLKQFDAATGFKLVRGDYEQGRFEELGFSFGVPTLISAAMKVLFEAGQLEPELKSRMTRLLLELNSDGMWGSTFEAAQVIFNTRGIVADEAKQQVERSPKAVLGSDGVKLGEVVGVPGGYFQRIVNPGPTNLLRQIRVEGLTTDERLTAAFTAEVPFVELKATQQGLLVQRQLLKVNGKSLLPVDLSQPLKEGEILISRVALTRSPFSGQGQLPSSYVVVEDQHPSLVEVLEEDREYLASVGLQKEDDSYWAEIKQTLRYPDRITRAVKIRPGAKMQLFSVWRVSYSGKASLPPVRAFDAYNERLFGNSAAGTLSVQ